jgi:hypothetical protein
MTATIPLWTALVSALALAACTVDASSSATDGGRTGDSGVTSYPGDDASGDAASVACSSRSGAFSCGPGVCSRAIQACSAGLCEWYGDIGASCGACPTCACLRASSLNVSTCDDDGHGGITFALYAGVEGDPCKSDANCANAACTNGVCHCLPAGSSLPASGTNGCCSGWEQAGTCTAQAGSPCTTRVPDCNGGTCAAGSCTCVGPGGYCNLDTDCCAGTTHCVQGQCQ